MSLPELAQRLQDRLEQRPLENSLKFDCGEAGILTLTEGRAMLADHPTDCTIAISLNNLEKLISGKLNPMTAFAMGRLKVSGDMSVALKLAKLVG